MSARIFPVSRSEQNGADRPYHHGHLRESLLTAALDLLKDNPPSAISLRSVAKEAGVSHAAPYHHFANRTALMEALGVACMERFVACQQEAVAAASSGRDALRDQGIAYVRYAAEDPHAFALIFDPAFCPPGNPGPGTAELVQENLTMLASSVTRAQEEGLFVGSDTAEVSTAMWGTMHGLAHLVNEGHLDLDTAITSLGAVTGGGTK